MTVSGQRWTAPLSINLAYLFLRSGYYSGQLIGDEDDYEWQKIKITGSGNMYAKQVKNPIRQLKRQVYLLAHYL